ncbi:Orn/Lys/Arg decarboxylase-like protein, partial [Paraburkholderia bryophila]
MLYDQMFGFLFCCPLSGGALHRSSRLQRILAEVVRLGYQTTLTDAIPEASSAMRSDAGIGLVAIEWSLNESESDVEGFIRFVRGRGLDVPIFVLVERHLLQEIPVTVLGQVTGYIFAEEDTPEFVARNLVSHLHMYVQSLKTPFFGAMVDYAEQANQMWTCPGHNGGIFYQKSPIGRAFVQHMGEAVFRNDLDNSVTELGDLLVHEGPALAAEKAAARIFGADRTYFVLNGTSTSNKIALTALVAPGDLVLFDRNNHKAAHHGALLLGGGIPVYLQTQRNAHGMIGPIDFDALDEERIRTCIRDHPLIGDREAWKRKRPFRVCAVKRWRFPAGASPARQMLQPEATGAAMEATKWLKP